MGYIIVVFFLFHFLLFLVGSIFVYSTFFQKEHRGSGGTGAAGAFFALLTIAVIISLILSGILTAWVF